MTTGTHRRLRRCTTVLLAVLMTVTFVVPNPAAAGRSRHVIVDRQGPGHRVGHHVRRLPPGHHRIHVGPVPYFFHGERYYRPARRGGYTHVRPPVGAVLAALPLGFLTLTLGSLVYFYHSDVYYRRVPAGYIVVEPPRRDVVVVRETPVSAAPEAQINERVVVTAPRLNVRSGPGTSFGVIGIIDQGMSLEIRGSATDWLYVRLADGRYGWVQRIYTTASVPAVNG